MTALNKGLLWGISLVIAANIGIFALRYTRESEPRPSSSRIIRVVAGENFWGSLVSQLGGNRVQVTTIVSDPNADPHEYESTTDDARAVANADYVILNGAGYDSWGDKLLGAGQNPGRKVLNIADLLGKKEGDNPHFFYGPDFVNQIALRMDKDLVALDPASASYFRQQYEKLKASFAEYQGRIAAIRKNFSGTKVAATEDIFTYLASAAGLDLVSPADFMRAVGDGNDPPAASVAQFENLINSNAVRVLVYNKQTITPLTENIKRLAAERGIPVVGITEIITPPNRSYQDWMNDELIELQNALNGKKGKS